MATPLGQTMRTAPSPATERHAQKVNTRLLYELKAAIEDPSLPNDVSQAQTDITALQAAIAALRTLATDTLWDAKGDLVAATGNDAAVRVAVGADGTVLTADAAQAAGVKWATPKTVATDTIWDTKGDLVAATGADAAAKVPVGTNGQALLADSTQATGVAWGFADKHGDRVLMVPASAGQRDFTNDTATLPAAAGYMNTATTTVQPWAAGASASTGVDQWHIPIPLNVGDRIKSVKMYGQSGASTTSLWQLEVYKSAPVAGGTTSNNTKLGTTQTTTNPGGTAINDSLTVSGLTETVAAGTQYFAVWSCSGAGVSLRRCYMIEVTYDHP